MSEPFIAQITMFGGNFAPRGWALCDGQLLAISQNQALFSLLGTTYGGDGETTFGLPGLRGRTPIHAGTGPGLSTRKLGSKSGTETNTLNTTQLPSHNHPAAGLTVQQPVSSANGNVNSPAGNYPAVTVTGKGANQVIDTAYHNTAASKEYLAGAEVSGNTGLTGGSQPVNNMQPYLAVNYIIALSGVFPSPS